MDPTSLVSRDRAQRAAELMTRLKQNGFEARGAFWAQTEGDGQPYLYIITPNIETEGLIHANRRLGRVLHDFQNGVADPFALLDPFEIKLIRLTDPLAREVLELYQRSPDDRPTFYCGSHLTPNFLEPAYIYPAKMFAAPAAAQTA
jgi:hypothetical protein